MDNGAVSDHASDAVEYNGPHPSWFLQASLSARSMPNRRHAHLFSKDVPKIVTRLVRLVLMRHGALLRGEFRQLSFSNFDKLPSSKIGVAS
jgi:hypothetical protein